MSGHLDGQKRCKMNIEKSLQEIMNTALEHANPIDPAAEDWQYVHAIAYDILRGLNKEVE